MFVHCESFHGLGTFDKIGVSNNLISIYGIDNLENFGSFGGYFVDENFDNGQPAIRIQNNLSGTQILRMGPGITGNHRFTSRSDWYIHFAYGLFQTSQLGSLILSLDDTTTSPFKGTTIAQCILAVQNQGSNGNRFLLLKNDATTVLASSSFFKQEGIYYFQLHVNIGNSGSSRLLINGIEQWNVSGIDTQHTANNTANAVSLLNNNFNRVTLISNVVIGDDRADGLTPSFNTLMGEFVVGKIQPNDVGDSSDFNPVGTANNWDNVNDYTDPDDDTTYNETSTSGNKDLFNYEDVGIIPTGIIFGWNLRTKARKTDAGTRSLQHIIKPTTTEYSGYTHPLISTYTWFTDLEDINQDTGLRYTDAEINNHQFGYRLS